MNKLAPLLYFFALFPLFAQQQADTGFKPEVPNPAWRKGKGPVVGLDEAHHNFHTVDGRYAPFAELLRLDGFVVRSSGDMFHRESLKKLDILVIANALHPDNLEKWSLPTPACFTEDEVAAVKHWVEEGGSLFLIVDHMPFPGAAANLAAAFGATFSNGFAFAKKRAGRIRFPKGQGLSMDSPISADIKEVVSFTGSAFRIEGDHQPLLTLPKSTLSLEPETAWEFDKPSTKKVRVGRWLQGAVLERGKGRVAIFGEAAMFSAQTAGNSHFGMNAPDAPENARFLLNLMHWLSKKE